MRDLVKPQKPYKLKRWRLNTSTGAAHFVTCARPGRTSNEKTKNKSVPDETVHRWILGLQKHCGANLAIVSLLGRKHGPEGLSEFAFYCFHGAFDTPSECENRPTFQEWLHSHHKDLDILVREHPTYDLAGHNTFLSGTLDNVKAEIKHLVWQGRTVVVMDSGGETRTKIVATYMDAKEDSSHNRK